MVGCYLASNIHTHKLFRKHKRCGCNYPYIPVVRLNLFDKSQRAKAFMRSHHLGIVTNIHEELDSCKRLV